MQVAEERLDKLVTSVDVAAKDISSKIRNQVLLSTLDEIETQRWNKAKAA